MHRMNANLNRFLDQTDEAEKSYHEAARHYRRLADDYPDEASFREGAALVARDFASHLQRLGRYPEASAILDESIRLYEELQAAHPDVPTYRRVLANTLLARSDWDFQVGKLSESEAVARRSAELYAQLADTPGTRPEPVDPLFRAMAEHNLAIALREQGHTDEALAAHDAAVERIAGLTKVTNSRDAWSFYHRTRTERAWTLALVPSRAETAIADLESAIAGWDKLIKQLGENPTDLERKAVAGLYCGRIRARLGQRDAAVRDLSSAAKIMEGLVGKQPEIPLYRYDLGRACTSLGRLAGDPREADGWYRKAREMLEAATRRYPENVPYRQALTELDALTGAMP
jgi:tetratricopeptide (TPR) repeat protein